MLEIAFQPGTQPRAPPLAGEAAGEAAAAREVRRLKELAIER